MSREMLDMVEVLAREKNVEQSAVFGVLELALASAVKKSQFPGDSPNLLLGDSEFCKRRDDPEFLQCFFSRSVNLKIIRIRAIHQQLDPAFLRFRFQL